ncbi:hypothetical protein BDZ85DRAFT_12800 [Elsinoe ampelina]|uniref:Uncharacterized protein n=1 Tax=Elsinoe ampelina TaxID=302913 RepID=A0A6A6GRG8_9PEZI|nr:hypothetical protein BDZ85DRAFT_12800 [Elsinoe ampelina]
MGQSASNLIEPIDKAGKQVRLYVETRWGVFTVLSAKFHEKDELLVDQAIKLIPCYGAFEEAIMDHNHDSVPAVVKSFLDNARDKLMMLSADGWRSPRMMWIRHDGSQIYTAFKKRRGVTIQRWFQTSQQTGGGLQVMLNIAGWNPRIISQSLASNDVWDELVPPVTAGWKGDWALETEQAHARAVEARYPAQTEARRNSIMKLQKDGLEQLIVLPPEIQQRAFSQLLDRYRYVVDLRVRSSVLSPSRLCGRLASHVEEEYCGTGLLEDDAILEAFAEAEVGARKRCTPLFLFDADAIAGKSAIDDTPANDGVNELLLANQLLPEVEEIHVAVMVSSDDESYNATIVGQCLRKCLQLTPNTNKINLRIFLNVIDSANRYKHTKILAAWPWREKLGLTQSINAEAYEYEVCKVPSLDPESKHTHALTHVYPSTHPMRASHIFWAEDYLGLVDCALGKPTPRDVLEPLEHVYMHRRRHVLHAWATCETELLFQTLRVYTPCSIVAGEYEQCRCQEERIAPKVVEGRLVDL